MPRTKKTEIIATDTSQLSVFDYSSYSEEFKLKSYERKARIKANEQVATKAFYDIAQDVKDQHDDMSNYEDWLDWCKKELDYQKDMSCELKLIAENLVGRVRVEQAPTSFRALRAFAKGLRDADEETKKEILTAVESKTEEKGKALTEKEIKELIANQLGKVKQILSNPREAVKHTNEDLADQFSLPLAIVIEARENIELKRGEEILKGDRDFLDSKVKDLENKVKTQESKVSDLEKKEQDLKKQEEQLEKDQKLVANQQAQLMAKIDNEANAKAKILAKEELDKHADNLAEQRKKLEEEKAKIEKELKDVQSLKRTAQRQKDNLDSTQEWITNFQLTNTYLVEATHELKKYKKHLQKNPDLSELEEKDRVIVEEKIKSLIVDFNDNLHNLGGAINYLNGAVVRFNNYALRVLDAEVKEDE